MHCGVQESPQWRKGPQSKPVVCNACGTRYRRTNSLGPAIPSTARPAAGGGGDGGSAPGGGAKRKAASPPGGSGGGGSKGAAKAAC
ncbi:hypothetical protein MNEG_16315 [Monoraphidium neglectum]|uniref:GATA-type domain-containing protein n=1 Tax=Monoraphidium neglectum TaxID=145388 RepID=A0A0D2M8A0_9CHLO|nr:hypothetical protein MNEG_16315 [Monoraphidium neglectum]KIY91650.1 hypothetical protein MNEG_16315 [Monoraphidium neglectum]|eukprot:XP_013890670.1 hypothetical protein MNEG_16315 [Monoraphidium neglectum]